MKKIAFDPCLLTGFEAIDEQHRLFMEMLGELAERIETGAHHQGFMDALQGMRLYAESHFTDEEVLMSQWGYPELLPHCGLHESFRRMAGDLEIRAKDGPGLVSLEMLEFLGQWFIGHIRDEDQRFAAYTRSGLDTPAAG
jgi:hemerythrin-like metal-binding protein